MYTLFIATVLASFAFNYNTICNCKCGCTNCTCATSILIGDQLCTCKCGCENCKCSIPVCKDCSCNVPAPVHINQVKAVYSNQQLQRHTPIRNFIQRIRQRLHH